MTWREMYERGDTLDKIGEAYGVHPLTVVRWAQKAGLPPRHPSSRPATLFTLNLSYEEAQLLAKFDENLNGTMRSVGLAAARSTLLSYRGPPKAKPSRKKPYRRISIRIPNDELELIEEAAAVLETTVPQFMLKAIKEAINGQE